MNPKKPGTDKHPTGQRLNISLAFANNKNRWQRAAFRINEVIEAIPRTKRDVPKDEAPSVTKDEKRTATLKANNAYIKVNSAFELPPVLVWNELILMDNAVRYEYLLDAAQMDRAMASIEMILRQDILSGSDFWTTRFFMNPYIQSSSEDGTTDSIESAIRIVEGTSAEQSMSLINAQQQLQSPAYLDRLRMANGRVFESMKGVTGDMKSQLRVTLTEGVARGVGIRDLKGMINKRLGIGMGRSERIARTEINHVYRTAYMDEAKELNETALKDDEWEIKQVHRSSLSPTTRHKHALRHGSIYTMQQQNTWWALDGNAINCLCSTLDVLVSRETGEVLQSKMVDRMLKQREQFTGVAASKTKKVVKPKVKVVKPNKYNEMDSRTKDFIDNNLNDPAYYSILKKTDAIPTYKQGKGAYYRQFNPIINMPISKQGDNTPLRKATYRHEFGHHVDHSSAEDGKMWFTGSTEYRKAAFNDQQDAVKKMLFDASKGAKKSKNTSRRRGAKGIAGVFDADAADVVKSDAYQKATQSDELLKAFGDSNIKSGLAKDLYDSIDWSKQGGLNSGSRQRAVAALKVMNDNYNDNELIGSHVAYHHYLSSVSTVTELGQVADVSFAMTKGLGGGHSEKYYKSTYEGIEIFAQIFSTRHKDAHPLAKRMINAMVPKQVKIIEDLLK